MDSLPNSRPDTATTVRPHTNHSFNRDINNSMIIQPAVRRPESGRVKSHSQGNMNSVTPFNERDHTPTQTRWSDAEIKKKRISTQYGVDPRLSKTMSNKSGTSARRP